MNFNYKILTRDRPTTKDWALKKLLQIPNPQCQGFSSRDYPQISHIRVSSGSSWITPAELETVDFDRCCALWDVVD